MSDNIDQIEIEQNADDRMPRVQNQTRTILGDSGKIKYWIGELEDAYKREKGWRKDAKRLVELFECERRKDTLYNILYANTETMSPALYNTTPRPDVRRRFKDEDQVARAGGLVLQRVLEFLLDNNLQDSPHFDTIIEQTLLEALVVGRGVVRFRYEFSGEQQIENEGVSAEVVAWQRFRHGYGKQWKDVSWVAFQHFMSANELEENFQELGKRVPLNVNSNEADHSEMDDSLSGWEQDEGAARLGMVWEVWDKVSKKVYFFSPSLPDKFLRVVDDPLNLSGFFPIAAPLMFFPKISSLEPVPLFAAYEGQAKELNKISVRIAKIIDALRVRGFYDSTVGGLDRVLEAGDNELIAAENVVAMQQGQTLEKSIWLMPLNELVLVLQQLYTQREQIKTIIYEITGISDIIRGASSAYETATAQQFKNQWGSLRLRRLQKRMIMFVRECLRVMAEISCRMQPETLAKMTGLQYPHQAEQQQAQQILQQMQGQVQQLQMMAQQDPRAGQQLQQLQGQMAQHQAILNKPNWEQIMSLLGDSMVRNYRVDIEANSTLDAEAAEDGQKLGEFLNAFAQFMNGIAPLVQQGYLPMEAGKEMLLAITRRYRFGEDVEDSLKQITAPQQQGDQKQQAAAKEAEAKIQQIQQKGQVEAQKGQMDIYLKQMQLQQKQKEAEMDMALKAQELQVKQQEIAMKEQLGKVKAEAAIRETMANQALKQAQHQADMEAAAISGLSGGMPVGAERSQRIADASNWRTGKGGAASNGKGGAE